MPTYLLVLISVLVCLAIIALLYAIIAYRRMAIAYKKVDYLVEDLTYKSEILSPAVGTVAKLAEYAEGIEGIARKNATSLLEVLVKNKPKIRKMVYQVKAKRSKAE